MRFVLAWLVLAAFWVALSGHFDAIHLALGAISVTLVSLLAGRLLTGEGPLGQGLGRLGRLALFCPWLLGQVVAANVDVLLRVLGLRPVAPTLVRFRPSLSSDFGKTALANSITLTPGTVTIDVREDGEFVVHAIAPEAADAIRSGRMERRVAAVEGPSP